MRLSEDFAKIHNTETYHDTGCYGNHSPAVCIGNYITITNGKKGYRYHPHRIENISVLIGIQLAEIKQNES